MKQIQFLVAIFFLSSMLAFASGKSAPKAGNKTAHSWTANPFEQKVFIENKGQFDGKAQTSGAAILFSASIKAVDLYFNNSGVCFRHDEWVRDGEEEKEEEKKIPVKNPKLAKKKEQELAHHKTYFLNLQWLGSNPNAEIIADDQVANYFTYSDQKDKSGQSPLKANAFKKITYKNIYPHIDIEYSFPNPSALHAGQSMTSGIKYTIILHPGADPKAIQMQYDGAEKLFADIKGNLTIKSLFGEFVDHAPVTFYKGGAKIKSSFSVNEKIISFQLGKYDASKTLIIDPWTTVPVFTGTNEAYEIDWDYQGNVYVYGGSFPLELVKLSSTGATLWTYVSSYSSFDMYGDFAVDRSNGTSYIADGGVSSPGAEILKVNASGIQVGVFPGDFRANEFSRIAFNSCTHKGVVACGNTSESYQVAVFDSNLTSISPVDALSANEAFHDMALLAIDDTNAYLASSTSLLTPANFDNVIIKVPVTTASPTAYIKSDGHSFTEYTTFSYIPMATSGFNGMAKSKNYLFTYDGSVLKKFNPMTGILIGSITVSVSDMFMCGGIAVDGCDNVYVGCRNSVKQYNSSLTLTTSASTPDTVHDVAVGIGGEIYACGSGFAAALPLFSLCSASTLTVNATSTPVTCSGNDGSATVTIIGGTPPFSYLWQPGGQTTAVASGLAPGSYQVIVFPQNGLSCSNSIPQISTVTVTAVSGFTQQTHTFTDVTCSGANDGTASISVSGGTLPYTYLWSSGQITSAVTGLSGGTYIVTVKDGNGCQTIDSVIVVNPSVLTITPTIQNITCDSLFGGAIGSITLNITGGTSPFTYAWSSGESSKDLTGITVPGVYTVTVTDGSGCSKILGPISITGATLWSVSSLNVTNACNGSSGAATITLANGSFYTMFYDWYDFNFFTIGTDSTVSGLVPGTYYCEIYDFNFCKDTFITVTINSAVFSATMSHLNSVCNDTSGTASITVSSGTAPYTYHWSPTGQTASTIAGLSSGTYTVIVADASGCSQMQTVVITGSIPPVVTASSNITIIGGNSVVLTSTSIPSFVTYLWSPTTGLNCTTCSNPTAKPSVTTTYCVKVTDANGCTDMTCLTVTVETPCAAASTLFIPDAFSPNNDGENDVLKIYYDSLECIKSFHLRIYDRWGEKIFEASDAVTAGIGWNGTRQGIPMDPQVFVYELAVIFIDGTAVERKGNVSLLR